MDVVFNREYKNAVIEIVIEDDIITPAKVYMDGECVETSDVNYADGREIPYSRKNLSNVVETFKVEIDRMLMEDEREIATNMSLVAR